MQHTENTLIMSINSYLRRLLKAVQEWHRKQTRNKMLQAVLVKMNIYIKIPKNISILSVL